MTTAADVAESNHDNDNDAKVDRTGSKGNPSSSSMMQLTDVTMHPLVLLSAADHYHRVARGTRKRVVGVLLGSVHKGHVDVVNSFAVPFEEDAKNPAVFFFDHNYLETMLRMFKKVAAKEHVVGFYSSGPQIRPNDLRIHDVVSRFGPCCVFCVIDIRPNRPDLPVIAYKVTTTEDANVRNAASSSSTKVPTRTFDHLAVHMGALEAEEIGVEHLLRDINDPTISTVASLVKSKLSGLATLAEKLQECKNYLEQIAASNVPANPEIVANLQTILTLLPNLNTPHLVGALMVKTNDLHMAIYLAALIRAVIALHDLINNKIRYGQDGIMTLEEEKKEEGGDNKEEVGASAARGVSKDAAVAAANGSKDNGKEEKKK